MRIEAVVLRRLAWVACSLPLLLLVYRALTLKLGGNPVEALEHELGSWALIFLLCSLSITPLRQWFKRPELAVLRRTFGLFAFSYALLHVLVYAVLDRGLLVSELLTDLSKRPYVMLGAAAFVLLALLAATSPKRVVRALGAARWKTIHLAVYVAASLAVAHFMWLKWDKNLLDRPLMYLAVLVLLLAVRLPVVQRLYKSSSGRN